MDMPQREAREAREVPEVTVERVLRKNLRVQTEGHIKKVYRMHSYIMSNDKEQNYLFGVIVGVKVVFRKTVVGDRRLSGSHL